MLKFKCLYDDILVRPDPEEEKVGDIYIPENFRKKPKEGEVVSVGIGRYNHTLGNITPLQVCVGDRIRYKDMCYDEVEIDGEKFLHLKEMDIIGRWVEDGE